MGNAPRAEWTIGKVERVRVFPHSWSLSSLTPPTHWAREFLTLFGPTRTVLGL